MAIPDELVEFGFDVEWYHPCGNIPIKYLGVTPDGMDEVIWSLRKGSQYPPERHAHSHILTIECGWGIISVAGQERKYSPGDSFNVAGNVPHGFVRVDTTTVVIQSQPATRGVIRRP